MKQTRQRAHRKSLACCIDLGPMDGRNLFEGGTDGSSIMAEPCGCTAAPLPTDSVEEKDYGQDETD